MAGEQWKRVRESLSHILSEHRKSGSFQVTSGGQADYLDRFDDDLLGNPQTQWHFQPSKCCIFSLRTCLSAEDISSKMHFHLLSSFTDCRRGCEDCRCSRTCDLSLPSIGFFTKSCTNPVRHEKFGGPHFER